MACIEMFNTDHQGLCAPMSPRISFSNDFADAVDHHKIKRERGVGPTSSPGSSDFEFTVSNYSMIAADEIFCKGRLLPLKENCTTQLQKMTLREELLVGDDDEDDVSQRPPKGPIRWKELLGLKKGHAVGKKHEKVNGPLEILEREAPTHAPIEAAHVSKAAQDVESNGGSRFVEIEI
ncbi:uncharacterized protein LOC131244368 [Magnolia sinica]|uniref:uncharacterized protein LOC131244368 n=1 Tax=Magnolia sinica TaxID=86752 RepID=UPI00265A70AD|nr:uncharacterized protein LOC131244368 [Magnolia sinica]